MCGILRRVDFGLSLLRGGIHKTSCAEFFDVLIFGLWLLRGGIHKTSTHFIDKIMSGILDVLIFALWLLRGGIHKTMQNRELERITKQSRRTLLTKLVDRSNIDST